MSPKNEPPMFVKWILGITSPLVVAGIVAIIAMQFRTEGQLARISAILDSQSVILQSQSSEIADAQIAVKALELLVGRINDNHADIKKELEDLQRRLKDVEEHINP